MTPLPGDVIAVAGRGWISRIIERAVRGPVTHVAVMADETTVVESTTLADGQRGVFWRRLDEFLYQHRVQNEPCMLLPIRRGGFKKIPFRAYLIGVQGRKYDWWQAWRSAFPPLPTRESDRRLFCSELVARAHEAAGLYRCNASDVNPMALCRMKIYSGAPVPLIGEEFFLSGYNSTAVNAPESTWYI